MPPINTFCIWKRYLRRITQCDSVGNLTITKLGPWFPDFEKSTKATILLHNNNEQLLKYCPVTESWNSYERYDVRFSNYVFLKTSATWEEDISFTNYFPVDLKEDNLHYYIYCRNLTSKSHSPTTITPINTDDFHSYICTNRTWTDPLLREYWSFQLHSSGLRETDTAVLCSDGGLRNNCAGFGVVFSINNSVVASTQMRMKQGYNEFTSYRMEAVGMLGAMALYDKLQEYTKLKCGIRAKISMKLLCDNEALVKTINRL
jgi:hypothetical protein